MLKPMGGKKKLKLDVSVTYTVEDIKKLCIDLFKNELTNKFFTHSMINLAKFDNSYIFKFTSLGESEENFWSYSSTLYMTKQVD